MHNTGHWTMDGAETSQFENHLRAVLGWPLGSTESLGLTVMVNLIGKLPAQQAVLDVPNSHYHHYGKAERAGRKVGHVNVRCADEASREAATQQVLALL